MEKSGGDVLLDVAWIDNDSFVTVGSKVYYLWKFTHAKGKAKTIKKKRGSFGKADKDTSLICVCTTTGVDKTKILVGSGKGNV